MKCELLAESNIMLLLDFIDDMNTKYDENMLKAFLDVSCELTDCKP